MTSDTKKADPFFGAAVLKLMLERKGMLSGGGSEILKGVLEDLGITENKLDEYIDKNMDMLEQVCRERGIF